MPKPPKHILVIRLSAMGDVAMTVPVLRAFTQQYPDVKLTVLTRGLFTPFFRDLKTFKFLTQMLKKNTKAFSGFGNLLNNLKN